PRRQPSPRDPRLRDRASPAAGEADAGGLERARAGAGARPCRGEAAWLVGALLPPRARRHGVVPARVRLRQRGAGPDAARPLRLPLPGAGRGEHGDPPRVRHRGAEARLAGATRRRAHPELLLHDRAADARLEPGVDGHPGPARGRHLDPRRAEVVHHRRRRRELRHRDGGDRSRAAQRLPPGEPDHRRHGHAGGAPAAEHLGHGRAGERLGLAGRDYLRGRPRTPGERPRRARGRVHHRPGPARPRPHPPLHAVDRHLPARLRAPLRPRGVARAVSRAAARAEGNHPAVDRREPGGDRCRAPPRAPRRMAHRPGRRARGARRHLDDQVRRGQHALPRAGPGHPGPRRAGHHRRDAARLVVPARAGGTHLRRTGRGPPGGGGATHPPGPRAAGPARRRLRVPELDPTRPVRAGEELDPGELRRLLDRHAPELTGPVTVEQFPKGHSNLTYLLRVGGADLVLRRPPKGAKQIKAGHDMRREYTVLSRLRAVWPKVPRTLFYVPEEESPFGVQLYVMERVEGLILRGTRLPPGVALDPAGLRAVSETVVDTLVELHAVDPAAAGLADFGKPQGYVQRQVAGWTERYARAR